MPLLQMVDTSALRSNSIECGPLNSNFVDESEPLIHFKRGMDIKCIADEKLRNEKFGLIKMKLYGIKEFEMNENTSEIVPRDVQLAFNFCLKDTPATTVYKLS